MSPNVARSSAGEDAERGTAFDEDELRRLNESLNEGEAQFERGEYIDAEVMLRELRARRAPAR